jgi:hypothetical protein
MGYRDDEMQQLKDAGVVDWPTEQAEEAAALS